MLPRVLLNSVSWACFSCWVHPHMASLSIFNSTEISYCDHFFLLLLRHIYVYPSCVGGGEGFSNINMRSAVKSEVTESKTFIASLWRSVWCTWTEQQTRNLIRRDKSETVIVSNWQLIRDDKVFTESLALCNQGAAASSGSVRNLHREVMELMVLWRWWGE